MSAVVLRCPNCGTTRSAPGECDACHEAPVRYYCTQHRPGLWLEGPTCGQCGSRFGAAAAPPPRPAPATPSVRRPPAAPPRPPFDRGAPPMRGPAPKRPESRVPPLSESFDALDELLRGSMRSRGRPPAPPPEASYPVRKVPSVGGCLMRLFFLAILMFVFGIGSLILFGGAFLRMFGFY